MLLCGSVFGFTLHAHTIISPPLFFAEPTIPMTSRDALYGVGATPLGFFLPPPHRASFQTTWRNACGWRLARRPDTTLPASHLHLLHVALELARRAVKLCHVVGIHQRALPRLRLGLADTIHDAGCGDAAIIVEENRDLRAVAVDCIPVARIELPDKILINNLPAECSMRLASCRKEGADP